MKMVFICLILLERLSVLNKMVFFAALTFLKTTYLLSGNFPFIVVIVNI